MSPGTQPLRTGLLVEAGLQPWNLFELVDWARSRHDLSITHLLLVRTPAAVSGSHVSPALLARGFSQWLAQRLFGILTRIETPMVRSRVPGFRSARRRSVVELGLPTIEVELSPRGLEALERLTLDLVVTLEPGPAGPFIARAARLGVIAVEHGVGAVPPVMVGFHEVCSRKAVTEFRVVHHRSGDSRTLLTGGVRNRPSFLLNQTALMRLSLHHLERLLGEISVSGAIPDRAGEKAPEDVAGASISLSEMLAYSVQVLRRVADKLSEKAFSRRKRGWSVHFAPVSWPQVDPARARIIENPPNAFLADPFVIASDGKTYCFVEELEFSTGRGCISAYELETTGATRIGKVIVEPFHMSFPYLFRYGSGVYMVPETATNGDVRIYECSRMPDTWTLRKSFSLGAPTADTMLFEHGGRWWMFTNPDAAAIGDHCSELRIYHADDPFSDHWIPHAANPISLDPLVARNGGILFDGGSIYRVAQRQGFDRYGLDFSLRRIEVLTPDSYLESAQDEVLLKSFESPSGVHHVHANGEFCVFDHDSVDGRGVASGSVGRAAVRQVGIARSRA